MAGGRRPARPCAARGAALSRAPERAATSLGARASVLPSLHRPFCAQRPAPAATARQHWRVGHAAPRRAPQQPLLRRRPARPDAAPALPARRAGRERGLPHADLRKPQQPPLRHHRLHPGRRPPRRQRGTRRTAQGHARTRHAPGAGCRGQPHRRTAPVAHATARPLRARRRRPAAGMEGPQHAAGAGLRQPCRAAGGVRRARRRAAALAAAAVCHRRLAARRDPHVGRRPRLVA